MKKSLNKFSSKEILELIQSKVRYNSHKGVPKKRARISITTLIVTKADQKRLLRFFKERDFSPRLNERTLIGGGLRKELRFGVEETRRLKELLGNVEEGR